MARPEKSAGQLFQKAMLHGAATSMFQKSSGQNKARSMALGFCGLRKPILFL
jgi:hypothetical protein